MPRLKHLWGAIEHMTAPNEGQKNAEQVVEAFEELWQLDRDSRT